MEVRNSAGHRVSLLNDEASSDYKTTKFAAAASTAAAPAPAPTTSSPPIGRGVRLPPFSAALAKTSSSSITSTTTSTFVHRPRPCSYATHSYSSQRSYGSTSSASTSSSRSPPDTPPLERSDSRDSSMMNGSLSPSTPTYADYDAVMGASDQNGKPVASLNDAQRSAGPYFGTAGQLNVNVPFGVGVAPHAEMGQWYNDGIAPMSPPFGNPTPGYSIHTTGVPGVVPYAPTQPQPALSALQSANPAFATSQPLSSPTATNPSDRRGSTTKGKNNKFPCPLAAQYNCSDTFTTSGHAARHAKKHTGKKDAICPECRKAFTRKDNMEQHRRTHKNSKNQSTARSSTAEAETSQGTSSAVSSHARKASTASVAKPTTAGAAAIVAASPRATRPAPLMDPSAILAGGMNDYVHSQIDPALPVSPTSSFGLPTGQYNLPPFNAGQMVGGVGSNYPDPTGLGVAYSPLMGAGAFGEQSPIMGLSGTHGLEALSEAAAAASNSSEEDLSGLKRR